MTTRLSWPGCLNVRDLGGLPTVDGGRTRSGALIRADNLAFLTAAGVQAVRDHGVSRIIDLRSNWEAEAYPGPFVGDPSYRLLPLIHPGEEAERDPDTETTPAVLYANSVIRNAMNIVAGVAAIADAPPGAVLVHCHAGKDRTGIVVALVLRVAGVTDDAIAADYAESEVRLAPRRHDELAAITDDDERRTRQMWNATHPATIRAMLARVDGEYGGVSEYLLVHGLTAAQLKGVRDRLLQAERGGNSSTG